MNRKLVSGDEAIPTDHQHASPCADCPWSRTSLPGWLGDLSATDWLQSVQGESRIDCHTWAGPQCAGAAIFRKHLCKLPRNPELLRLSADRTRVFSNPTEFLNHHQRHP